MARKATALAVATLALLPTLARAQAVPTDSWSMYQYRSDHNAVFEAPDWDVTWRATTGGTVNGGMSLVGETLYVESSDREIRAIDALTGQVRWSSVVDGIAVGSPLVGMGVVLSSSAGLERLDPGSGAVVWEAGLHDAAPPGDVLATIGASPGFIFAPGDTPGLIVASNDGSLRGVRLTDGRQLWQTGIPGAVAARSLILSGDHAIGASRASQAGASSPSGWIWAANVVSGRLDWLSPCDVAGASPTLARGLVAIGVETGVVAVNAADGSMSWEYVEPGLAALPETGSNDGVDGMYANGVFFQSIARSKAFVALDARNGALLWKLTTGGPVTMSAVEAGGLLYFGDATGMLYVVRATDGSIEAKMHFRDPFANSPPIIVGRTLFIANGNAVYALRLGDFKLQVVPETR